MKTRVFKTFGFFLVLLLLCGSTPSWSQANKDFYTVKGVVKDKHNYQALANANISLVGTSIGTVTNSDGEFSIKIKDSLDAKSLEVSLIGYSTETYRLKGENTNNVKIYLESKQNILDPVTVYALDPEALVKSAIEKVPSNYTGKSSLLSGFYRETIKKRSRFVNVSEAVVDIYKTPYSEGVYNDAIQICKGRKLLSPDPKDTLLVRLLGGPNLSIYVDAAKNPDLILNAQTLSFYKYKIEGTAMIDNRPQYVVSFTPQVVLPYALFYGKLYIDINSLAFSRAEMSISMEDRNKATEAILKKKPFGLHFKPEEISFMVTYKLRDGISYLNYIRSNVRFKCDWKKRLFSTNYTIVSETVITGVKSANASRIPYKQEFKDSQSLTDNVKNFADPAFWEDYNIIEPDQSLETAVNRLKKENSR